MDTGEIVASVVLTFVWFLLSPDLLLRIDHLRYPVMDTGEIQVSVVLTFVWFLLPPYLLLRIATSRGWLGPPATEARAVDRGGAILWGVHIVFGATAWFPCLIAATLNDLYRPPLLEMYLAQWALFLITCVALCLRYAFRRRRLYRAASAFVRVRSLVRGYLLVAAVTGFGYAAWMNVSPPLSVLYPYHSYPRPDEWSVPEAKPFQETEPGRKPAGGMTRPDVFEKMLPEHQRLIPSPAWR